MKGLLLVWFSLWRAAHGSYFKEIENLFVSERGRQATNVLQEDLAGGTDSPKLITISYPAVSHGMPLPPLLTLLS